ASSAPFCRGARQKVGAKVRVTMPGRAQNLAGRDPSPPPPGPRLARYISPEETSTARWPRHIEWGEWADLYVIAPCTANSLGKIAGGLSDNMLTATVLAARCPVLICPTMDGEMYEAPAVKRNLQRLQDDGYHLLEQIGRAH